MSDIAIKVENISKRYRIGLKEETKDTFVGAMGSILKSPLGNLKKLKKLTQFSNDNKKHDDIIWALKDVSFEVKKGEVIGIIGANGAGKSTLLKILAQITHPTSGRVELNGRVASLLEVGTGFHPELTGRENIYLNGTILGMTKKEIDSKLEEIIDFSGVEKFIDTPVKRYSSGMRVRLAFSVAAHLDPEILLIDEVLAVGDAEFQKKCLGKMDEVAKGGRTVLFVSHNMGAVEQLCENSMLICKGKMIFEGRTGVAIRNYFSSSLNNNKYDFRSNRLFGIKVSKKVEITNIRILDRDNSELKIVKSGQYVVFAIDYIGKGAKYLDNVLFEIKVKDQWSKVITSFSSYLTEENFFNLPPSGTVFCSVPMLNIYPADYLLTVLCFVNNDRSDWLENSKKLTIVESNILLGGKKITTSSHGIFYTKHKWYLDNP